MQPILKVMGADFELSNALAGVGTPNRAAVMLLCEIDGYPRRNTLSGTAVEFGRRFLNTCAGSAYIDSSHLELNLPEHTDSAQHAAILHAGLRIARRAQVAASRRNRCQIHVIANCSDGQESWGPHFNALTSERTFLDLTQRKPHYAGLFATHLVTSVLYTGQGMVGPGNGRSHCTYQLSQRADWFEEFTGHQTTHSRPLLNLRAEHHAGRGLARLHIIYYDLSLSPVANFLKAGTTQLLLAMLEAGWCDPCLQLDDPVGAASAISRDLTLGQRLAMATRGRTMTALEIQKALADLAGQFVESGAACDAVPGAHAIVATWHEVLQLLEQREIEQLARKTDCWLKYYLVDSYRAQHGLTWSSTHLKALDLLYGSLDDDGLFFQMAGSGQIDSMPTDEEIDRYVWEPPDETRAYLRAHVLRRYGDSVGRMDWGKIHFRVADGGIWWSEATLDMPDPRVFGRAQCEPILNASDSLEDLLERLAAESAPGHHPQTENDYGTGTATSQHACSSGGRSAS